MSRCQSLRTTQQNLWNELDLELEDEDAVFLQCIPPDVFTAKIESVYLSTVDKAANALQKKRALEAKAAKTKEDQIQKLLKSKPEDLLNAAIDDRIAKKGGKGGKPSKSTQEPGKQPKKFSPNMAGIVSNMFQTGHNSHDICAEHLGATKPSASHSKGRPQPDPKPDAKSKGKGRGSSKGKSKGKGKHLPQPGKGAQQTNKSVGFRGAKGKGKGGGSGKQPQKWKDKGKGKGKHWRSQWWPSF